MSQTFILETEDGEEFEVNAVPGKAKPTTTFGPDQQGPKTDFITTPGTLWTVYKGVRVLVSDLHVIFGTMFWLCHPLQHHRRRNRKKLGLCLECGYNLKGLTELRCPECGEAFEKTCSARP